MNENLQKLKIFLAFTAPLWLVFLSIYLLGFLYNNFEIKEQHANLIFMGCAIVEIYFLTVIWQSLFQLFNKKIFPALLLFCLYLFCAGAVSIWAIYLGMTANNLQP